MIIVIQPVPKINKKHFLHSGNFGPYIYFENLHYK